MIRKMGRKCGQHHEDDLIRRSRQQLSDLSRTQQEMENVERQAGITAE